MTDFIVLPPPKRTRSRRLRKKLRIGEFQALGFDYELTWQAPPSIELQNRFIDQMLEQFIEPRALSLGGGVNCGFRGRATGQCHGGRSRSLRRLDSQQARYRQV